MRHGHYIAAIAAAQAEFQIGLVARVVPEGKFHFVAKPRLRGRACNGRQKRFNLVAVKFANAREGVQRQSAFPEKLLRIGHGLQRASAALGMVGADGINGVWRLAEQGCSLCFYKGRLAPQHPCLHPLPWQGICHKYNSALAGSVILGGKARYAAPIVRKGGDIKREVCGGCVHATHR